MRPAVVAVLFACLLVALAATSTPRAVGDGSEYVHLSNRLASLHLPGAGESRHFLFYSALAAPLVALLNAIGLDPLGAFTLLNGLLLVAAFYVASSRLHWTGCALVFRAPHRLAAAGVLASAVLGVWTFHPARSETADRPTRLASFLWTRHPSLDNPLPEVFAERLRGLDENWLPVATPGCEKILLPGRGGRDSTAAGP